METDTFFLLAPFIITPTVRVLLRNRFSTSPCFHPSHLIHSRSSYDCYLTIKFVSNGLDFLKEASVELLHTVSILPAADSF